ncbi:MAG: hypothetical protein GF311_28140 [Candidatus Lokiarchaeota archaeon]|nr:hypothetical protein [Candidatus Lokiarchaeota archaeon]
MIPAYMNDTCLGLVVTKKIIPQFKALVRSLLYHNPWFNLPIMVVCVDLSEDDLDEISYVYLNLSLIIPNQNFYSNILDDISLPKYRQYEKYKYELIKQFPYKKIIILNTNTIILGSLKKLFMFRAAFGAVRKYVKEKDCYIDSIDSSIWVFTKNKFKSGALEELERKFLKSSNLEKSLMETFNVRWLPQGYGVDRYVLQSKKYKIRVLKNKIMYNTNPIFILNLFGLIDEPTIAIREEKQRVFLDFWRRFSDDPSGKS